MTETGDRLRFIAGHAFDSRPDRDGAERIDVTLWRDGRFTAHIHRQIDGSDAPETIADGKATGKGKRRG